MRQTLGLQHPTNAQRSAKYVQNIFENQNNQETRPFRKTSESNSNS